jgi:hypothetical protein
VRGVEDWVTDAAMNALVCAAWADPEIRGDVAGLIGSRFVEGLKAYQHRMVTIIEPMAQLVLATPEMPPEATALARELVRRLAEPAEPEAGRKPGGKRPADKKPAAKKTRRGLFGRR